MGSGASKEGKPGKTKDQKKKEIKTVIAVAAALNKAKPTPVEAAPVDEGISDDPTPGEQQQQATTIAAPKAEEVKPSPSPSRGSRKKVGPRRQFATTLLVYSASFPRSSRRVGCSTATLCLTIYGKYPTTHIPRLVLTHTHVHTHLHTHHFLKSS